MIGEDDLYIREVDPNHPNNDNYRPDYSPIMQEIDFILIFGFIAWFLFNSFIAPNANKISRRDFTNSIELSGKITGKLSQVMARVGCDRVLITTPHNGSIFVTGGHQWKLSAYYETVKTGYDSAQEHFQNVPSTLLSNTLMRFRDSNKANVAKFEVSNNNYSLVEVGEEANSNKQLYKMDGWLSNWHLNNGVDYAVILPIYSNESNLQGDICALLHIHWLNGNTASKQLFSDFDTLQIRKQVDEIRAHILSAARESKNNPLSRLFMFLVGLGKTNHPQRHHHY